MPITDVTIDVARTDPALRAIEPIYGTGVLHPEVLAALQAARVKVDDIGEVNLVARAAAMRTNNPALVWSTFYNPNPKVIQALVPACWAESSFDEILDIQFRVVDKVLRPAIASVDPDELAELAALCRTVTEKARTNYEGRPLFAGLASLPMPTDDHMMVWHAARLLREHRGDGHIAALVVEGLNSIDALVVHAAMLPGFGDVLRRSRRWSLDDWNASMTSLRRRGWLTDDDEPTFTPDGRARRAWIEDRTNELAAFAFEPVGDAGVERMIELGTKVVADLEEQGLGRRLMANIPLGD